jgi:hypothetical protein
MILKILTHLVIILPLSSRWDDIQAAATPDPDDDVLAAQDNDYLPAIHNAKPKVSPNAGPPFHRGLNVRVRGSRGTASDTAWLAHALPFLSLFPDPLHVLMSLQC